MAIFVLIAGAWHGAWCWEKLTPLLERRGHTVLPVELPGIGADRTPIAQTSLADWADRVADVVHRQDQPVILTGHSRGGIVISETAERVPDRIAKLVYLCAILAPDGKSIMDAASIDGPPAGTSAFVPDAAGTSVSADPAQAGALLYSDCMAGDAAAALARLRPEPLFSLATPVSLSPARYGMVPRAYVECLRDQTIPIALQRAFQRDLPCGHVERLDTGHSPFLSAPEALADALDRIAALDIPRPTAG